MWIFQFGCIAWPKYLWGKIFQNHLLFNTQFLFGGIDKISGKSQGKKSSRYLILPYLYRTYFSEDYLCQPWGIIEYGLTERPNKNIMTSVFKNTLKKYSRPGLISSDIL